MGVSPVSGLVLSLFPGIGLLDMAFEAEGFCVVRGPDVLWGGDIRTFHPPADVFEGVSGIKHPGEDLVKREKCMWHLTFCAERSRCSSKRAVDSVMCPKHRDEGRQRLGLEARRELVA